MSVTRVSAATAVVVVSFALAGLTGGAGAAEAPTNHYVTISLLSPAEERPSHVCVLRKVPGGEIKARPTPAPCWQRVTASQLEQGTVPKQESECEDPQPALALLAKRSMEAGDCLEPPPACDARVYLPSDDTRYDLKCVRNSQPASGQERVLILQVQTQPESERVGSVMLDGATVTLGLPWGAGQTLAWAAGGHYLNDASDRMIGDDVRLPVRALCVQRDLRLPPVTRSPGHPLRVTLTRTGVGAACTSDWASPLRVWLPRDTSGTEKSIRGAVLAGDAAAPEEPPERLTFSGAWHDASPPRRLALRVEALTFSWQAPCEYSRYFDCPDAVLVEPGVACRTRGPARSDEWVCRYECPAPEDEEQSITSGAGAGTQSTTPSFTLPLTVGFHSREHGDWRMRLSSSAQTLRGSIPGKRPLAVFLKFLDEETPDCRKATEEGDDLPAFEWRATDVAAWFPSTERGDWRMRASRGGQGLRSSFPGGHPLALFGKYKYRETCRGTEEDEEGTAERGGAVTDVAACQRESRRARGDEVETLRLRTPSGETVVFPVEKVFQTVALPGVACGDFLRYRYEGDRPHSEGTVEIQAGTIEVPEPGLTARTLWLGALAAGGFGYSQAGPGDVWRPSVVVEVGGLWRPATGELAENAMSFEFRASWVLGAWRYQPLTYESRSAGRDVLRNRFLFTLAAAHTMGSRFDVGVALGGGIASPFYMERDRPYIGDYLGFFTGSVFFRYHLTSRVAFELNAPRLFTPDVVYSYRTELFEGTPVREKHSGTSIGLDVGVRIWL